MQQKEIKTLLFHLTGNENVKGVANGLAEAGLLGELHVSLAAFPNTPLDKLSNIKTFSEIRRRKFSEAVKPFTKTFPAVEVARIIATKFGLSSLTHNQDSFLYIDNVVQRMDKNISRHLSKAAKKGINAVYGYEDCTSLTFKEAKKLQLKCFYDLPIGYWRTAHQLLERERERWPEWTGTLSGFKNSPQKLLRKDEELRLADKIFVASSFTASTLQSFKEPLAPVKIIPYGFPQVNDTKRIYKCTYTKSPIKLLFVGGLSQRKGIANLFEAVNNLKDHVELTLVGYRPTDDCKPLNEALAKHTWIPTLSHDKILALMRQHDVLVFPSLFEGFGLVITEAMSQGTPVITTDRTVGPDVITNGINGWLVDAGSTEHLQAQLEELIKHPNLIEEAGRNAMNTALQRPWSKYQKEVAEEIIMSFQ